MAMIRRWLVFADRSRCIFLTRLSGRDARIAKNNIGQVANRKVTVSFPRVLLLATWSLCFATSYSVSPCLATPRLVSHRLASPRRQFFCRTWYSWLAGCLSSRRKSKSFRLGRPSRTLVLLVPDGNSSASVSIHRAGIELECCSKKQAGGCRRLVLSITVYLSLPSPCRYSPTILHNTSFRSPPSASPFSLPPSALSYDRWLSLTSRPCILHRCIGYL